MLGWFKKKFTKKDTVPPAEETIRKNISPPPIEDEVQTPDTSVEADISEKALNELETDLGSSQEITEEASVETPPSIADEDETFTEEEIAPSALSDQKASSPAIDQTTKEQQVESVDITPPAITAEKESTDPEKIEQLETDSEETLQEDTKTIVAEQPLEAEPEPDLEEPSSAPSSEPTPEKTAEPVETLADTKQTPAPIKIKKESEVKDQASKKKSLFSRLTERLGKTRESFTYQMDALFLGKKEIDGDMLDDLEEILITADLGVGTTMDLLENARRRVKRKEMFDPESLKKTLKKEIKQLIIDNDQDASLVMPDQGPFVIMVIGVNGVGKTTTIGKIAMKFRQAGNSVMLVAGDTFRAAAVAQLKIWGERSGVPVIAHQEGADPSSVIFDAIGIAQDKDVDVVLVDTAGRMHTKDNLMEELKKIKRVMAKKLKGAPHEIMLVIDSTTGQNGISQARLFDDAVGITGITLTKLDGTSKGGIVANICKEMKIPIRFIGIGEKMEDLRDFDADEFVEALFHSGHNQTDQ